MHARDLAARGAVILGLLGADIAESTAEAGFLKNGRRPGGPAEVVEFLRPPPPGSPVRIRPPGSDGRGVPAATAPRPRAASHNWFWAAHSPGVSSAGGARWGEVLEIMHGRRAGGQALIGVDAIRAIRAAWGPQIAAAARARNLSETLLLAVIAVESGGRPRALSPNGAQGLMQLIPATAARFGVADVFEPYANIAGGAAYLDWLLGEFGGDIVLALAGYNAGEGAVHRHGGVPPYAETRDYVVLVLDAIAAAGSLCDEPPAGPRAACRWKPEV